MNRSWSPQVVRMMPGHGFLMHNLPPSFGAHSVPSSRNTTGSTPKNGRLALPGFKRVDARQRRDEMSAGLGLPPGVHNRATVAADVPVIPHPRLGIDGFADRAEHAQRTQIVFGRPFIAQPDERADGRRRGVKCGDLEFLDNFPEPPGVGKRRNALEHQRRPAVAQRAINDVAVAGHPADVGGAEINVVVVDVEDVFVRERRPQADNRRCCGPRPWVCRWNRTCTG